MRLIHTADWHLCERLGRIDRTDDLKVRVERVAALCEENAADVLLIAGDLFSEQASLDQMTDALRHLHRAFGDFLARGGTIVALTGNHDRDSRIDLVRAGMALVAPPPPMGGALPTGRLYLLNRFYFGTLQTRPGDAVQFVLVPYPFKDRFDLSAEVYHTREEETRLLHQQAAGWIQALPGRTGFRVDLPTVLVGHLHVRGSEIHTLYRLTERDDVLFDLADLNPSWAYVALGHIHKPQCLGHMAHVRYSGSLDRMDFGEKHEDHGVWLVDVGRSGAVREPRHLPLPATPFRTLELTDPETELPNLADSHPDRGVAIVKVIVKLAASGSSMSRDEVTRTLRRLFPRLYDLTWEEPPRRDDDGTIKPPIDPRAEFEPTVRNFLEDQLKDDPDREDILRLAEAFLARGGKT